MTTRTFTRDQLTALGLPYNTVDEAYAQEQPEATPTVAIELDRTQLGSTRWASQHQLIFRAPDDGQTWSVQYQRGLTETQADTDPWNDEKQITATLMGQRETTVTAWQPVEAETAPCPGAPGQAKALHDMWGCQTCKPIEHVKPAAIDPTEELRRADDDTKVTPEFVSAMLRSTDTGPDAPYPAAISVFCDTCGTTVTNDFVVSDRITKPERLELARNHLRNTARWSCTPAGDFCPTCKPTPAAELRQAADDLEALVTAAHGTSWAVARTRDDHPEGDGAEYAVGIHPVDQDGTSDDDLEVIFQDDDISEEDANYIAAVGPNLGGLIVQLLRDAAENVDATNGRVETSTTELAQDIARLINNRPR
ncbi:hypothetical protein HY68_01350 [Streptomyces sp. AcH 505]|uniref:hypothetical protein n=1 Tax=Streptomyces sp. AcH 505 TaxID=352211 RepID=UPI000591D922|nr:hypothetical protein HY68_01350 [Streptomyces sp. AcH 505]